MKIKEISSRKILDSVGNWTIETTVELKNGAVGVTSVPSGVSVSPFEAKNVSAGRAVKNIQNVVENTLQKLGSCDQATVDQKLAELNVGANATLSVSLALARAMAISKGLPLFKHIAKNPIILHSSFFIPKPMVLLFEGGKHGSGKLAAQEFMAIAKDIKRGLKLYETVREYLRKVGQSLSVGLEGGFTPNIEDKEAVDILNYILGGNPLALDVAFDSCKDKNLNYQYFVGNRNVASIEDPFGSDDFESWAEFTRGWGKEILVVADDLVATNPERLQKAIERQVANSVIIKPNQIGTLTETLAVVKMAKEAGWKIIVSHRADETNDDFLADLAVAVGANFVKFGGFARGERLAKYNRLLEIQSELRF